MAGRKGTKAKAAAGTAPPAPAAWPVWAALLAAALLPLLVYWPTTSYGLLLDDRVLFEKSPTLSDLGSIPEGFAKDVGAVRKGAETVNSSYYRPLFLAVSTLYHQGVGGAPADWHRLCVFLAAAIGALACLFFLRLGFPPWMAAAASWVFSLHPSHVSSIAWASGLQELLAAAFVLAALLAATRVEEGKGGRLALAGALLSYAFALLSKEVAVGLLPFLVFWAFSRRDDPAAARRLGRLALFAGGLTFLYLVVRFRVLGGRLALPAENAPGFFESLPAVPVAVLTYLRLLLWPFGFSIFRPERPFYSPAAPAVLVAVAALAIFGFAAYRAARARRELALPLAFFACLLLPVLSLWVLDPQWMVTDRYLFLPSLALPWILGRALPARISGAVFAVLVLAFALFGLRYAAIFENERVFVAAMEQAEPTSPLIFAEKGRLLGLAGDAAGSRAAYARAVELDPIAPAALEKLGDFALQEGDFAAAEAFYRRALTVRPYASRGFKLVALGLARSGRRAEAARLIAESAGRWPEEFQVQLMHAVFLLRDGRASEAAAAYEAARALRPDDPAVAGGMDAALARLAQSLLPAGS